MKVMFALAAAATASSSVSASLVVRSALPVGWRDSVVNLAGDSVVGASDEFTFTVLVQDQNLDALREFVDGAADPTNALYGSTMSNVEVQEFTRPSAEDTATVTNWLDAAEGCTYTIDTYGRRASVSCSVGAAEQLLSTSIGHLVNSRTNQEVVRAGDYSIPDDVDAATAAIFGLHGLPIPKQAALVAAPGEPADVTPEVIATTYKISGVTPKGTETNTMAVAEFQGQNEKDTDLVAFFKAYVKNAQEGDDKISKFVGDKDQQQAGVEASLDIQYIMGVAPHIKSEFWLFDPSDFCADLENWTATILKDTTGPGVHSVSYGWQGDLSQLQCTSAKSSVVEANFVKIAATRTSIIFASGDSGSGYAPPAPNCNEPKKDVVNTGTVEAVQPVPNAEICCQIGTRGAGYSFEPPSGPPSPGATCSSGDYGKKDEAFVGTAVQTLRIPENEPEICCEIARNGNHYFSLTPDTATISNCSLFATQPKSIKKKGSYSGKPAAQAMGNCTIFSSVTGSKAHPGATSGTTEAGKVTLYPSWPASSPYVTSVGATRFVNQKVGEPEMATDQFGSGGGFSTMFDQASWQAEAVDAYTSNPPSDPHYPPAGSFPKKGRATPDVSALGEGYQVYTDGTVQSVGGTSASTPAFAGMIALINEAREQAGKPHMGLLNHFLYQNADCFTDVTLGTNAIGRGTGPVKYGFNATKGWDPATGLGSPIFDKLLAAALKV